MVLFKKFTRNERNTDAPLEYHHPRRVYDLELCANMMELKECLRSISENGCIVSSVTQDIVGIYTVVFSRFSYH